MDQMFNSPRTENRIVASHSFDILTLKFVKIFFLYSIFLFLECRCTLEWKPLVYSFRTRESIFFQSILSLAIFGYIFYFMYRCMYTYTATYNLRCMYSLFMPCPRLYFGRPYIDQKVYLDLNISIH
jgi:multisubunit Na+/H+ antiporter MnhF subunit